MGQDFFKKEMIFAVKDIFGTYALLSLPLFKKTPSQSGWSKC